MKRAADLLQSFFLKHGIADGDKYVSFFREWEAIVGQDLAAHADVEDIKNGALVVRVDHPAWMQILHMKKDSIVDRINSQFPDLTVSAIHMRLDTEARPTSRSRLDPRTEEPEEEPPSDASPIESKDETEEREDISSSRLGRILDRLGKQVEERNRDNE